MDGALACLLLAPFRCRMCRQRFYRFSFRIDKRPAARLPARLRARQSRAVSWKVEFHPPEPEIIEPVPENPEPSFSILIADSDFSIRKLLRRILERAGYGIYEQAGTGDLETELEARRVDLLIAELDPSEPQGLASLQRAHPGLKIIALSGDGSSAGTAAAVLRKPFRAQALLDSVRSALKPHPIW